VIKLKFPRKRTSRTPKANAIAAASTPRKIPNPYKSLVASKFWKRSVADVSVFDLTDVYEKKFEIGQTDRIASAGSCFAQHIAKKLRNGGYTYLDVEPAPKIFPPARREAFGYDLYSARFGNIYTPRQLLQLAQRATGAFVPVEPVWEEKGRYVESLQAHDRANWICQPWGI
jgi:hypothetical protein